MTRLSISEYELLLECIQQLHSFHDLPSLCTWMLEKALPQLVPSEWYWYNEVDFARPENTLAMLRPEANALFQRLLPQFKTMSCQNPLLVHPNQSNHFSIHTISEFLTRDAFHQLALYQDVYRAMRAEYQIAATTRPEPDCITAFVLAREKTDYTERDRTILEFLRPHLAVAFDNLEQNKCGASKPGRDAFGFTPRENEVSRWICEGKANSEIAAILGISPRTVHKHVEHIFEKTGVASRAILMTLLNGKAADGSSLPSRLYQPQLYGEARR